MSMLYAAEQEELILLAKGFIEFTSKQQVMNQFTAQEIRLMNEKKQQFIDSVEKNIYFIA